MKGLQECGPRRVPAAVSALLDDLAVDIDLEIKRRGWKMADVRKHCRISRRRSHDLSAYLRGAPTQSNFGLLPTMRLAEDLNIPIRWLTGSEVSAAA